MENNRNGYKAYEPGLICKGKKYEEGKTYEEDGTKICAAGMMHYCVNPFDVLNFYDLVRPDGSLNEFTTVTALEEPVTDDGVKFATRKLKIGEKLGLKGFVEACTKFLNDYAQIGSSGYSAQIGSSGDSAQIGSSGDYAQIGSSGDSAKIDSSGDYAKIGSSGDSAQIGSSGDSAQIGSSGYSAKIGSSGDYAQIDSSGDNAVIAAIGINGRIRAAKGSWITLAEYKEKDNKVVCVCVRSAQIDGETLKAGVWYELANGEFKEAT